MPTKYNKMYKEDNTQVPEEPLTVEEKPAKLKKQPKKEIIKEETPVVEEKIVKKGSVVGSANLNVRETPGGSIKTTITPGTEVVIEEEVNEEWFKISAPIDGFVMKKFIEVK